jgi:hypothetical protein
MDYQPVYDATLQAARRVFGGGDATEAIERAVGNAFGNAHIAVAQCFGVIENELTRASRAMRPRVFIDGNLWCALYGDNLQDGVAGFGDSPELACIAFDAVWSKGKAQP